jgi:hemerythrin
MALVWNEAQFGTGIDEIDAQHRELFEIVNRLVDAARQGGSREAVAGILDALSEHALSHFCCEEDVMERRNCSACVANKLAHRWFLRDFEELRRRFDREGVTPAFIEEVEDKVCDWLTSHLLAIDTAMRSTREH